MELVKPHSENDQYSISTSLCHDVGHIVRATQLINSPKNLLSISLDSSKNALRPVLLNPFDELTGELLPEMNAPVLCKSDPKNNFFLQGDCSALDVQSSGDIALITEKSNLIHIISTSSFSHIQTTEFPQLSSQSQASACIYDARALPLQPHQFVLAVDACVALCDVRSAKMLVNKSFPIMGGANQYLSVDANPNFSFSLCSGSSDGHLRFWDVRNMSKPLPSPICPLPYNNKKANLLNGFQNEDYLGCYPMTPADLALTAPPVTALFNRPIKKVRYHPRHDEILLLATDASSAVLRLGWSPGAAAVAAAVDEEPRISSASMSATRGKGNCYSMPAAKKSSSLNCSFPGWCDNWSIVNEKTLNYLLDNNTSNSETNAAKSEDITGSKSQTSQFHPTSVLHNEQVKTTSNLSGKIVDCSWGYQLNSAWSFAFSTPSQVSIRKIPKEMRLEILLGKSDLT